LPTSTNGTYTIQVTNTEMGVGAFVSSITAAQKTLPSGWVYTGTNKNNSNPNLTNQDFITGIVINNADNNGNNFGIRGTLNIAGNVFYDTTGLNNGLVDGTPIAWIGATQLHVGLYLGTELISNIPVQNNGTYSFSNIEPRSSFQT